MAFNNEMINWHDLKLFLAVAQSQGLVGGARITGVSAPTLSRRIAKFETTIGAVLFERHHAGYSLTPTGRELFHHVLEMGKHAQSIQEWQRGLTASTSVKVAAGYWTSVFIAAHLAEICPTDTPRIELLSGASFVNMSRRQAALGIRNKAPEQQGLARQKLATVGFAIYGHPDYIAANPQASTDARYTDCHWIVPAPSAVTGQSSAWIQQRLEIQPRLKCSTQHGILESAIQGIGLCILPCFIGSANERLLRCSPNIDELTHTQWLVSHNEDRHLPHIREVADNIYKTFRKHARLFC